MLQLSPRIHTLSDQNLSTSKKEDQDRVLLAASTTLPLEVVLLPVVVVVAIFHKELAAQVVLSTVLVEEDRLKLEVQRLDHPLEDVVKALHEHNQNDAVSVQHPSLPLTNHLAEFFTRYDPQLKSNLVLCTCVQHGAFWEKFCSFQRLCEIPLPQLSTPVFGLRRSVESTIPKDINNNNTMMRL